MSKRKDLDLEQAKRKLRDSGYKVTLRNGMFVVTIDGYPVRDGNNRFCLVDFLCFARNVPQLKQQEMFSYDRQGSLRIGVRRSKGAS